MNVFAIRQLCPSAVRPGRMPGITAFTAVLMAASVSTLSAWAVSPMEIMEGKRLFEREWPAGNRVLGGDGLGPLFNGQACATCHNQAGLGGGGDARFNAKTIGIESIRIDGGRISDRDVARFIASFHPGFVGPKGDVVNSFPLAHKGGSPAFDQMRENIMDRIPATFSPDGGSANAASVRQTNVTPINYRRQDSAGRGFVNARIFQRNTTALFGSGLIDQVSDKLILKQAKLQRKHPEVSGRPSTLRDGRTGKFGWRGNVASLLDFVDQASANEVGLETKRKPQGIDPTNPNYRNSEIDISDEQLMSIAKFVANLPAPVQRITAEDGISPAFAQRGSQVFESVGCAVCHTPNMQPAMGVYSDLLLHDMGPGLVDLNHATPYIRRITPVSTVSGSERVQVEGVTNNPTYYGAVSMVSGPLVNRSFSTTTTTESANPGALPYPSRQYVPRRKGFRFYAPARPTQLLQTFNVDSKSETVTNRRAFRDSGTAVLLDGSTREWQASGTETRTTNAVRTDYVRIHIEPTNWNQEWRTPPLWGVADSAPYMHDGRADTLLEAISMHGGESEGSRNRFLQLSFSDREAVVAFLKTLRAPVNVPKAEL